MASLLGAWPDRNVADENFPVNQNLQVILLVNELRHDIAFTEDNQRLFEISPPVAVGEVGFKTNYFADPRLDDSLGALYTGVPWKVDGAVLGRDSQQGGM